MKFKPLASSSSGNAYIIDDGTSRLLVECGVPYRRLQKLVKFSLSGLCGCLVSHEHKDHSKCAGELVKNGVPVYMTEGTAEALELDGAETFQRADVAERTYHDIRVGTFDIHPFATFHDSREPVGFLIRSRVDGDRLLFATDTVNLRYRVDGLNLVAIECNYNEEILSQSTHLPAKVIKRIRNSHMEVGRAIDFLRRLDLSRCRCIYLLHLSDRCSNEGVMVGMVEHACPGVRVVACPKVTGGK